MNPLGEIELLGELREYIEFPYLLTFMLFSYLVKQYFQTRLKIKLVYVVLIIATVLAVPYYLIEETDWKRLLFSYALGTSLHELIFTLIEKKVKTWMTMKK